MVNNNKNNNYTPQKINGADEALTAKANSTYEKPQEVVKANETAQNDMSNLREVASREDIISQAQWNALNKQFSVPSDVTKADAYLKSQLKQIQSGKTSFSDQVKDMMSQIQNREKFSYDVDADPLFQQALASAMNSGKSAMQDTIGQASALTGGYGSTYATTAANQAYNAFIEDAYNNLPQYYQMAMEAYQAEGDEMYRQLGMLSDADDREYSRMLNSYDATSQFRNQLFNEKYTLFRDSKTDAYNIANLQLSENAQLVNNAYNLYQASSDYANNLYERSYNEWADGVSQATQLAGMQNSDWWNQKDDDYRYAALQQDQNQFNLNYGLKQKEFNYSIGDTNNDGKVDDNDEKTASTYTFSSNEITQLENAYRNAGGGSAGEDAVLDVLTTIGKYPKSDIENRVIDNIIAGVDKEINEEKTKKEEKEKNTKWYEKEWEIKDDTYNGGWFFGSNWFGVGEDHNDTFKVEGDSKEYTYDELKKMINNEDISDYEKTKFLNKLRNQSKK